MSRWPEVELSELLHVLPSGKQLQQGKSPQCATESAGEEQWGVLKTTAIQPGHFEAQHNKRLPDHFEPDPKIEVQVRDLLLTCAGPRSRCGVPTLVRATRPKLLLSGKMYRFRADEAKITPEFLEQFLLSDEAQEQIDAMKTGISDSGLNLTQARFLRLTVPVPPLDEQGRIVEILEDHLSRLDAAAAYLDGCSSRSKSLARSVVDHEIFPSDRDGLSAAISEVDPVGRKRAPVRLQSVPEIDLPVGWEWCSLDQVSEFIIDGDHNPPKRFESGTPHVTAKGIKNGTVTLEGCTFLSTEGFEQTRSRYEPVAGDVIVTCVGTIGRVGIVPKDFVFSADRNLAAVRVDRSLTSPEFVALALNTTFAQRTMSGASGSTAQPHLYLRDLRSLPIPLPPLDDQVTAVSKANEGCSASNALISQIEILLRRSQGLRRSLLSSAFGGQL